MNTPHPAELTCQQLVELVTDYLEGCMGPEERARFEAHLRECPPCGDYVDQIRFTIGLLGAERSPTAPPPQILQLFRDWRRSRP